MVGSDIAAKHSVASYRRRRFSLIAQFEHNLKHSGRIARELRFARRGVHRFPPGQRASAQECENFCFNYASLKGTGASAVRETIATA